jgi:hypothetical protein
MSASRRRILRPIQAGAVSPIRSQQVHRWRTRLERERQAFNRWLTRLRRAVRAVDKQQRLISRLERQIAQAE